MKCGTCERFTLKFPDHIKAEMRGGGYGRCTLQKSFATVYNPRTERECKSYIPAQDMAKRINWMEGLK